MRRPRLAAALPAPLVALAILLAACGDDKPVSYSQPVGISLDARSGDVSGGLAISVDKNVNTENGNPYGAFVNAAVQRLGGTSPSRIAVTSLSLQLLPTSSGVTALEQVWRGLVSVSFLMNGSGTSYPVGQVNSPSGAGPVLMVVAFDSGSMTLADYDSLVQGSFKVVLAGPAALDFGSANATAKMQATFGFVAYQ